VEQSTLSASSASLSTAMADIVVGLSASLAGSLWHTCAICLEEMLERELMTHPLCGCMLCQPCLEMTKNHHGGSTFICPVCLKAVDADAGFVCMSVGSQEREIRYCDCTCMVGVVFLVLFPLCFVVCLSLSLSLYSVYLCIYVLTCMSNMLF
jgi:hypothetical protein